MPRPTAFRTQAAFRAWLRRNHRKVAELLIRCYKVHAAAKGMTYAQAVDEALCFGWIDGVRRALDDESFSVRFSPRRAKSIWSAVNIRRAGALEAEGRMQPSGLAAFRAREEYPSRLYSYESKPMSFDPTLEKMLTSNRRAWEFFQRQAPWYRRITTFWVMSAKREETRERRMKKLIHYSARGEPVPPLKASPAK